MPLIHSHIRRYLTVWRSLRARWTRCQVGWFTTIYYHCSNWHSGAWELGAQDGVDSQSYFTTILFDSVKELESKVHNMLSRLIHSDILPLFYLTVKELESKVHKMALIHNHILPLFCLTVSRSLKARWTRWILQRTACQDSFSCHSAFTRRKFTSTAVCSSKHSVSLIFPLAFIFFLRTFVMSSSFWRWIVNKL